MATLTTENIVATLEELKQALQTNDDDKVIQLLDTMLIQKWTTRITMPMLESTKCGLSLSTLSKNKNSNIATKAKTLVDAWKKIAVASMSTTSSSSTKTTVQTSLPFSKNISPPTSSSSSSSFSSSSSVADNSNDSSLHPYDQLYHRLSSPNAVQTDDLLSSLGFMYDNTVPFNRNRKRILKKGSGSEKKSSSSSSTSSSSSSVTAGPVIYWVQRDQRINDNWALLRAQMLAKASSVPLIVVVNLVTNYLGASLRAYGFMLRNLRQMEYDCYRLSITFRILLGNPVDSLAGYANTVNASYIVTDYSPVRIMVQWKQQVAQRVHDTVTIEEVDTHNIIPVWIASPKLEVGARTIRSKIHANIKEYCTLFPAVTPHPVTMDTSVENSIPVYDPVANPLPVSPTSSNGSNARVLATSADVRRAPSLAAPLIAGISTSSSSSSSSSTNAAVHHPWVDWTKVLQFIQMDTTIPECDWIYPGERGAKDLCRSFLTERLKNYDDQRNNPTLPKAQSNLSPYLHFGHISAQRVVLEVMRITGLSLGALFPANRTTSPAAFCEELVVRRELADNYCHYEPNYDKLEGAANWAQQTLIDHSNDPRPALYTRDQFEQGKTHEAIWNAMQMELIHRGKMHGWARMYWAKKILEWSPSPAEALETALYLNDKYNLDGRDPNGYVGCMWSIAGVHDMGWAERAIFGKIRYMNEKGTKGKFDNAAYIRMHPVRRLPVYPPSKYLPKK